MESFYGGVPGRNAIVKTFTGATGESSVYSTPAEAVTDSNIWYGDYFAAYRPEASQQIGIYIKTQDGDGYDWTGIAMMDTAPMYSYDETNKELQLFGIALSQSNILG